MECRLMLTATAPSSFQNSSSWWKWRQKRWKLDILIRNIAKGTTDPAAELKILTKPHFQNMHLNLCQSQVSLILMTGQWSDPGRIVVIKSKGERSTKIDCRTIWNPDNLAPNLWYYFFEHFLPYLSSTGMRKILFTDSFCQQFEIKHLTCQIVHFLILEPICLFGAELSVFY